jgi:hypothetical protein
MIGMRMTETCWAVFKRQAINLRDWCIWLVDLFKQTYNPHPPAQKKFIFVNPDISTFLFRFLTKNDCSDKCVVPNMARLRHTNWLLLRNYTANFVWHNSPYRTLTASLLRCLLDTYPAGLLWTSDQLVAMADTFTTHSKHTKEQPCLQRNLNPRSLQSSDCRLTS